MKYTTRLSVVRAIVHSFFVVAAVAMLGACGMPFDWSLDIPDDWSIGGNSDGLGGDDDPGYTGGTDVSDPPVDPEPPQPGPAPEGPLAIEVTADQFSLHWEASLDPVNEYRLYRRVHGESEWVLLVIGLNSPQATITQAELAFGQYDFAVSYVSVSGAESDLHSSLDDTADPHTGWYLDWTGT